VIQNEIVLDHRAQLELRAQQFAERREQALRDQRSPQHSAAVRIQIWERLHQVRLPRDPAHAILPQVAAQTSLTLTEVQAVQRARFAPAVEVAPAT
jgi:hypothetical protein